MAEQLSTRNPNDVDSSSDDVSGNIVTSLPLDHVCQMGGHETSLKECYTGCRDNLYKVCIHEKVKVAENHAVHESLIDICDKPGHKNKLIEYLCVDCDVIMCSVCSVTEHRTCGTVVYLLDIANDSEKHSFVTEFDAKYSKLSDKLQTHRKLIKRNRELVEETFDGVVNELKRNKQKLEKHLNELTNKAEADIDNTKQACEQSINASEEKYKSCLDQMETMRKNITINNSPGQFIHKFIRVKKNKHLLEALDNGFEKLDVMYDVPQ